jgi:hypothetical protein
MFPVFPRAPHVYRRQIERERGDTRRPVRTPSPKRQHRGARSAGRRWRASQHRALHSESVICFGPAATFIAFANNSPVSLDRAGVPTIPFDSGVRPPRSSRAGTGEPHGLRGLYDYVGDQRPSGRPSGRPAPARAPRPPPRNTQPAARACRPPSRPRRTARTEQRPGPHRALHMQPALRVPVDD